jgi:putative tryptophan/tyrosine transport system substrate-binding protein
VLQSLAAEDPESVARIAVFRRTLQQLGWTDGHNVRIDSRGGAGDPARIRKYAAELVTLAPDVILATGGVAVASLQQATRTVPIVFAAVPDPVGAGYVDSLARPGGNATGFTTLEYGMSGKWLELLKEIAPRLTRAAVLRDRADPSGTGQLGAIQAAASSFAMELTPIDLRDATEIERAINLFARGANGSMVVTAGGLAFIHRVLMVTPAARHQMPAVYPDRAFVSSGGLLSYGPDRVDQYRQAAGYIDRILRGEKPADLPVQAPTRYELAINLKTAKALGLDVPPTLIARADEV